MHSPRPSESFLACLVPPRLTRFQRRWHCFARSNISGGIFYAGIKPRCDEREKEAAVLIYFLFARARACLFASSRKIRAEEIDTSPRVSLNENEQKWGREKDVEFAEWARAWQFLKRRFCLDLWQKRTWVPGRDVFSDHLLSLQARTSTLSISLPKSNQFTLYKFSFCPELKIFA
jgi:hypothetical protein